MNRSRTNHLLKIEKENENKDIKIKHRTFPSKVNCSPVEKSSPTKINGGKGKTVNSVNTDHPQGSNQPIKKIETTDCADALGIVPHQSRLGPYMAPTPGPKPRLGPILIKRPQKEILLPPVLLKGKKVIDNKLSPIAASKRGESVLQLFSTRHTVIQLGESSNDNKNPPEKPMLSARSLSKPMLSARSQSRPVSSRGHSPQKQRKSARSEADSLPKPDSELDENSTCSEASTVLNLNLDLDLCSLDSKSMDNEVFYMARSIPTPPSKTSASSNSLEMNFRDVLDVSKCSMRDEEIKVVKDVLKNDENHLLLKTSDADPNLFKECLKTQLKEIIKNERVIKSALKKLSSSQPTHKMNFYERGEFNDLIALKSNETKYSSAKQDLRKKHTTFHVNPVVEDKYNEPLRRTIFEADTTQAADRDERTGGVVKSKSFLGKSYRYVQKEQGNPKKTICRSEESQKEYEKFLQSTLPLKRRVPIDTSSHLDMKLHGSGVSDDDAQSLVSHRRTARPQVNVTFKNVQSVKKEVVILRALGDRLEASLKRTASSPSLSDSDNIHSINPPNSLESLTKELKKIDSSIEVFPGRRTSKQSFVIVKLMTAIPWQEQRAGNVIRTKGLCHVIGTVEEYMIVSKTIDELRCEGGKSFYIPKSGHFERTSFEQLKTEPQILLQNLKPKTAGQSFNLLDHDPMFFNSFLRPNLKNEILAKTDTEPKSGSSSVIENLNIREGGDSKTSSAERKNKKETLNLISYGKIRIVEKKPSEESKKIEERRVKEKTEPKKSSLPEPRSSPSVSKDITSLPTSSGRSRCNRKKRTTPPLPFDAFDEPKNKLMKGVLIAVIQLTIFMGLIMAFTLPDVTC